MSRITAYEATDGTLFKNKEAYRKHQSALNLLDGVSKIASTFGGNDVLNSEIAGFIVANGEALKVALNGKVVSVPAAVEPKDPVASPEVQTGPESPMTGGDLLNRLDGVA